MMALSQNTSIEIDKSSSQSSIAYATPTTLSTPSPTMSTLLKVPRQLTKLPESIVKYYIYHLETLPPALAAVRALCDTVQSHEYTTEREAVDLVTALSHTLKNTLTLRILAGLGLDLFVEHLANDQYEGKDLHLTPSFIKAAGEKMVERGLQQRKLVANRSKGIIKNGMTIVIPAMDDIIMNVLLQAVDDKENGDFRVILVTSENPHTITYMDIVVDALTTSRKHFVVVEPQSLAHAFRTVAEYHRSHRDTLVIACAEAITHFGDIIAPRGTLDAAILANHENHPRAEFVICAELDKILGFDLTVSQAKQWGGMLKWTPVLKEHKHLLPKGPEQPAVDDPETLEALKRVEPPMDFTHRRLIKCYYTDAIGGPLSHKEIENEWDCSFNPFVDENGNFIEDDGDPSEEEREDIKTRIYGWDQEEPVVNTSSSG